MFTLIDNFLNKITMYRLILYYLVFLCVSALILSFFGFLPFTPSALLLSIAFITAISWVTNTIFAYVFKAPINLESVYITALILVLIITPLQSLPQGLSYLLFLAVISIWAMASKYILAIGKKHIFNPAALAVAISAIAIHQSASWWIGNVHLLPFVAVGGLMVVRKIRRFDMAISFILAALLTTSGINLLNGLNLLDTLSNALFVSPLLFFAFVMITEPLTTPPARISRIFYGVLVGFLFSPSIHFGSVYFTPELALLTGNIFSYLISPKQKLMLTLRRKILVANNVYEFIFESDKKLNFKPGQYLEWTLDHDNPDSRGNRRYFTIASSPGEKYIRLGVKFYPESSSFKKALLEMKLGDQIVASQLAGEFTLPEDKEKKLVFIAGGIGITPFRSMIKYLLDNNEKRSLKLLYANNNVSDVSYGDVLEKARAEIGVDTVYTFSKANQVPDVWFVRKGSIDDKIIKEEIPDYSERTYYISGPYGMVVAMKKLLQDMGIKNNRIETDFFPGLV